MVSLSKSTRAEARGASRALTKTARQLQMEKLARGKLAPGLLPRAKMDAVVRQVIEHKLDVRVGAFSAGLEKGARFVLEQVLAGKIRAEEGSLVAAKSCRRVTRTYTTRHKGLSVTKRSCKVTLDLMPILEELSQN